MERFQDKIALVTGGSRGIGRSVALQIAREGGKVGVFARHAEQVRQVVDEIGEAGGEAVGLVGDVRKRSDVEAALSALLQAFHNRQRIHVLINNAGLYQRIPWDQVSDECWGEMMDVNVKGTFLASQIAARIMKTQSEGGKIVNVSSAAAYIGSASPEYAASKAAVIGLTRAMAQALAPFHINVNVVVPGPTDTDMLRAMPEERKQRLLKSIPIKRFAEPDEIAHAIAFLASSDANYITGTALNVNGGLYMD
ncbi:MAG: 3-oxoacyl-ACP reductase FabG [Candidatus Peribacteraceae bacterium]|nr:3-oxoacyl-ACP reductase FabG [Candidatus Peribacteraceae bacterium]